MAGEAALQAQSHKEAHNCHWYCTWYCSLVKEFSTFPSPSQHDHELHTNKLRVRLQTAILSL
eukprot:6180029-Pleurochrysis_carterae.AAC.8